MYKGLRIDCHTHIISEKIRDEYFSRTTGYAIVLQMAESIMKNPDCLKTVLGDNRLFFSPVIDLKKEITPQLKLLSSHTEDWKMVGLKMFLTYQTGKANDQKLIPVYDFAAKHGLTITYHTGLPSLVLPCDMDMEGSRAFYVGKIAKEYPELNFVVAHMDDPRFMECIDILSKHNNIFSDFSGAYETGTKEGNDVEGAIKTFGDAIRSKPGMEKKIMYGTDFCPPINLSQLEEYDTTIEKIFSESDFEDIYYKNALRAFPRIKKYLGDQK